jgi:hypothetical protein
VPEPPKEAAEAASPDRPRVATVAATDGAGAALGPSCPRRYIGFIRPMTPDGTSSPPLGCGGRDRRLLVSKQVGEERYNFLDTDLGARLGRAHVAGCRRLRQLGHPIAID